MAKRKKQPNDLDELVQAADALEHDREAGRLRAEVVSWKRKYESANAEIDAWERRWELCSGLGQVTPIAIPRSPLGRSDATAAILVLSDWHAEEDIDPKTCNNLNKFNPTICEKRVHRTIFKALEVMDAWKRTWPIDELVVAALGDFIAGYIHEELEESNHMSPTEATIFTEKLLADGITTLRKETKLPICVVTAQGNHGRTTRKTRIKTGHLNSYEWMMYHFLAKDLRGDSGIRFQIADGYHNMLDVKGHRVRFHHGDAVKYYGGVGGVNIPLNKAIAAWNKSTPAALDVLGHWHGFEDNWRFIINGCLCGYSDFSLQIKADYQPPTQTLIMMSKKHGKVAALPLFLE